MGTFKIWGTRLYLPAQFNPGAFNNVADIVGIDNVVIGPYGSGSAALYSDGVVQDLNSLVPAGTPFYIAYAEAINDSGQIIGGAIGADNSAPAYPHSNLRSSPLQDQRQRSKE